ncbi:FAD-linked oxidase C-terminal domain-containing protein [Hyphococcus lacteus]|uniref:FAD-linked oxidase C-terminal domain-containing protein n=1 Tax=Hyphococcus lacteus TaxID=3143536 RepID=A0ABV3Z7F2_9PROT
MLMPTPNSNLIARRAEFVSALRTIVPGEGVIDDTVALAAYECDGLTAYRQKPMIAVLPETVDQVSEVLRYCHNVGLKVVPRGAGTSLSGGALPLADGIILGLGKFNKILDVDYENQCAVVQPGVTNLAITHAVTNDGFYYAPDPSSQIACSIGGNVAENAGGVHCLKYGTTTNNLMGVEIVLMDGTVLRLGGKSLNEPGLDLLGVICGSEGLLGVVTEVTVRILPVPEIRRALLLGFNSLESAGTCVSSIIGQGIIPAGMEIMDKLAIEAAEAFVNVGYPLDAEAIMIVELDGSAPEVDHLIDIVHGLAKDSGATSLRVSNNEDERLSFWAGRKAAFPAIGRISPDYYCIDGTIPRRTLPEVLTRINKMSDEYNLRVANVFHAGDGNLHPMVLYDASIPGELEKAEKLGSDILTLCVDVGGVLTGEHGVGVEKRDLMEVQFSSSDIDQQQRLKCAFDDQGLLNPGKVFPKLCRCAELGQVHVHGGKLRFPELDRL